MDEQRAWLRARRKRRLRTLAVILSVCVLFTSSPHIWETVSVFAAEELEGEGRQYISGFAALPEEVREQSVPLGTGLQELSLPDVLEAYISAKDAENSGGGVETPGDSVDGNDSADKTGDEGRESEDGGAVSGENESDGGEQEPGGGSREEEPDGENEPGNGENSEENPVGETEENGSDNTEQNETGNADQAESDEAELKQETYTVTMPEYQAENVETAEVKTLIGGVTWDSAPAYDADTAGTYIFTAALPEGYTVAEDVALPQIAVTIREAEDAARNCGWHFGEECVFPEGELFCEDGDYSLVLAGGDSGVQIPFEEITSYLPTEVILEYSSPETGSIQEEAVPIIGWNCSEYVEDEEGNLPYSGRFFFQAHFSKNGGKGAYGDIEGAGQIGVTLVFDAPMTMAADHPCNGITFSAWENDTKLPNAEGNYYLTKDVTVTGVWKIEADIKLCLNGHRISCSGTGTSCVNIDNGGSLSVYDCQNSGELKLINKYTGNKSAATGVFVNSDGTFSLYSGLITAETDVQSDFFFDALYSNGKIYLYGGSMTATASQASAIAVNSHGEGHIYGGIYTANGKEDGTDYGLLTSERTYLAGNPSFSPASVLRMQKGLIVAKEDSETYTGSKLTVFVDSIGLVVGGLDAGTKPKFEVTLLNENYKVIQYPVIDGVEYIIVEGANTVSYDANGGTGEMAPQTFYMYGDDAQLTTAALQKNAFTKSGYAFGGWNTKPDGTGTAYADQEDFTGQLSIVERSTTLYAQWTAESYTIAYSGLDGATLVTRPTTHTYGTRTEVGDPEKRGYTFAGWKVNGGTAATKGLTLGATEYTADITLTATWTPNVYTAAFDYQSATDGNTIQNKTVTYGGTYGDLPAPARTGYTFKGWYTSAVGKGTQVTAETTVTATDNHTLYAYWTDETAPDAPALQAGVTLPADWTKTQTAIPLTLYDGVGVTELWVSIDGGEYTEVEGFTGNAGTTAYAYTVSEGEHTYRFKAMDAAGNASPERDTFTVMLDTTNPAFGDLTYENKAANLWQWIIGRKSMVIHVPVTDNDSSGNAGSGVREITYTMTPAGGSAQEPKTAAVQKGEAKITFSEDFKGDISIACTDAVGNAASSVTVSMAGSGGVIVEDTAPTVTLALPGTPQPNDRGWYLETFDIAVTVTDDKDSGNNTITSGGIAKIKWKDGEDGAEQTVTGLPGASPVYKEEFAISVNTDGVHTYYVRAVDNAGNESGWQTVTVRLDISAPEFSRTPSVTNRTQEGADITFTPSESGKVYWIVFDSGTAPSAQEVVTGAQGGAEKGGAQDVTGSGAAGITVTGLTPGEKHTVYVVLEDAAGNLSVVKEASFTTLQKAPEIALNDLTIDREKETVKLPGHIGEAEVYTNPNDPSGSQIQPEADGSLPVKPGTPIYIRYPQKQEGGETTPASDSVKIDIPGRPAAPAPKQTAVTDTTVTVTNPAAGEEYILVEKGSLPDWNDADKVNETGKFTGLDPNKEYDLYVRKKATEDDFVSGSAKIEVCTSVTIKEPVVTGEGAGQTGNTAPKPAASDADGGTVSFTGTYGEEYTPVIKVGGHEINPETTWDERAGKGTWEYPHPISEDEDEIEITVEFRKRAVTAIAVTPESLKIYADHVANRSAVEAGSMAPLTEWLEEECIPKAAYDNKTEGTVQGAVYATTDQLAPKGGDYNYTVSAEGKTTALTLTVASVNAAVIPPSEVMRMQKSGGYTQAEVAAWLPAQVTVTYTGTGYTAKTESRPVTWNTAAVGADFGGTLGEKTIGGMADLPDWATGQTDVSISIAFVDKQILTDSQMNLSVSGWTYGAQEGPAPRGSVTVADTNPAITYLYSADGGVSWTEAERLPKSGSGHTVPGTYQVKMIYTGDNYMGTKTAAFTVEKRTLTVEKGTLEAEDKNYDGTLTAVLKAGGEPTLTGVLTGDTVTADGTLRAEFAEAGPKKNIAVTVTGFELEGGDAGYYVIGNTSVTLRATINKADGTPPSDGKKPGGGDKDKDEDKGADGNNGGENDGSGDGTGNGGEAGISGGSQTPVVSLKNPGNPSGTPAPAETDRSAPEQKKLETGSNPGREPGAQPTRGQVQESKKQGDGKNQNAVVDTENKTGQDTTVTDNGGQTDSGTVRSVTAAADQGRIVVSGEKVPTGNVAGMEQASTAMTVGNGAVFVTVVCEDEKYAAGVNDTAAVANAVLSSEQVELVNDGGTIEIRVDVKDISEKVPQQDQEVIENGLVEYQKEVPNLTLGRYIDISMFIKMGESDWDAIASTEEPIEVVIGIPEDMREDSREFYIIRAHEGEHTFMHDLDEEPDTVTISTDMFSSYAIAYAAAGNGNEGGSACGLCHICPTFLGVCCFIWLAAVTVIILLIAVVVLRREKEKKQKE